MSVKIDIHADDFGESLHASKDILECLKNGKLDSISVLANMSCFEKCAEMYRAERECFKKEPLISVHLNLMEGRCLSEPEILEGLVDREGHFCISWEKLFFQSWLPGRSELKNKLKKEIFLQIEAVKKEFPEMDKLRIDSHQHTHMIPVVADALFEVLEENQWEVEYIRNAKEPIGPFLKMNSLYSSYQAINFVKNILLNFCSVLLERKLKIRKVAPMYLWGLIMSGHMDEERVRKLLPSMVKKAEKKGRILEILFHPGRVLEEEISEEFSQKDAILFHVSKDREIEKEAVLNLSVNI